MPHICRRCKTRVDAVEGLAPRCPACGGTTFSYVSARRLAERESRETAEPEKSLTEPEGQPDPALPEKQQEDKNCEDPDSVESIRILEPGRYDLNLLKLAESDDRVIRVGKDANYRLDLLSMMRTKKKEK